MPVVRLALAALLAAQILGLVALFKRGYELLAALAMLALWFIPALTLLYHVFVFA